MSAAERMPSGPDEVAAMDVKDKQRAYHDYEARTYEDKFSISYDERCIEYARDRFAKVVEEGESFGRVLEVGAGTGFFIVNLALAGRLDGAELHATDISPGMLEVCAANALAHGLEVRTRAGDAEALPYEDGTFDLVIGHAFLHHLPVPALALAEMRRVLAPGGTLVIAGEPTELGDRIAHVVKRAAWRGFRAATAVGPLRGLRRATLAERGASSAELTLAGLELEVDLHTFRPRDVAHAARLAGLVDVRVVTEELTANWLGWAARTIEGSVAEGVLGARWAYSVYGAYRALTRLDEALVGIVPAPLFYNLILHARRPAEATAEPS
jgi:ubiquinone/menaquinone biosynthesis C-methylase UbiE